jgi:hypothetical protein
MSLLNRLKRLLNIRSVQDTVRGLSQREQQQRIDVHKLCLYTSFYQHQQQHPGQSPAPDLAQSLIDKVWQLYYSKATAAVSVSPDTVAPPFIAAASSHVQECPSRCSHTVISTCHPVLFSAHLWGFTQCTCFSSG